MRHTKLLKPARVILALALVVVVGALFAGCSDSDEGVRKPNQAPKVWLSSAPPEGATEKYTIQMYWGGWDPDGEIAYYEYAITDNEGGAFDPADTVGGEKWSKVYGNDSIFTFSADELADTNTSDLVSVFLRSHTFFIRAVDEEGLASTRPAYRSFTARTLSPRVSVIIPPGGSTGPSFVPPITTFRWTATDYVDDLVTVMDPDSVSWILEPTANHGDNYDQTLEYIRNLPVDSPKWDEWGGWAWYGAPNDSGKFWTTPPLDFEPFLFAIRAKDEAGAVTPVFDYAFNVRKIQVSPRSTGPTFTVRNIYMGSVTTAICHEPVTILDLPAGVPVNFCWNATAEHYGGLVTGYRYGWDIEDLSDPDQWEIDYTPFTSAWACSPSRTFYFGTHTFSVEVVDNSGYCSRVEVKVNIVQFTMENNLLVVDDFAESTNIGWNDPVAPGQSPSDAQHDAFWESMLEDLAGFSPSGDVISLRTGDILPLVDIAKYKSIIWNVYASVKNPGQSVLNEYIIYRPPDDTGGGGGGVRRPNVVALYLAAGGHLLLSGNHPASMCLNLDVSSDIIRFPLIFLYEIGGDQTTVPNIATERVGEEAFGYRELCLETLEFAWTDYTRRRSDSVRGNCPNHRARQVPPGALRDHTMRGAFPVDVRFPVLDELRPEAAGVGREFNKDNKGWDAEVYNPQYFFDLCRTVTGPRACFHPIYELNCIDTLEVTYRAPVAFWTSTFADRVADAPGAVPARSAVFGFAPVFFKPEQIRGAIEVVVYDEWQLPRRP